MSYIISKPTNMCACLFLREGCIRYQDFLGTIQEEEYHPIRLLHDGDGDGEGEGGSSVQKRLQVTFSRAIDRGVDYRREMELEDGGAGGRIEEGLASVQRQGIMNRLADYKMLPSTLA